MKNKILFAFVGLLIGVCVVPTLWGYGQISLEAQPRSDGDLTVRLASSKLKYLQGEPVSLDFEVMNSGSSPVQLNGANVESGYLKLFIARSGDKFKQYSDSTWGRGKADKITIDAGRTVDSYTSILWNFNPTRRFSNVGSVRESYVMTDFAFPDPGVYEIKAVLYLPGQTPATIESNALQVVIEKPVGADLEVWNKIQENSEIAYFIQHASFSTYDEEARKKLIGEVRELIQEHPESYLTNTLGQNIEKYQLAEVKRKQAAERLKPNN